MTEETKRNVGLLSNSIELKTWVTILSDTNGLHITNQAKAECLNNQFVSVFTCDDERHLPDKGPSPFRDMATIQFTQSRIEIWLKNIDQTKATGPCELPAVYFL